MRILHSLALLFLIFDVSASSDPLQQLVRSVALEVRTLGERILDRIPLPSIDSSPVSFQNDPGGVVVDTLTNLLDMCPVCQSLSQTSFFGTWHIVFWNRNFLLNTVADINSLIEKMSQNSPISDHKTFGDLFDSPPTVVCPQITILDSAVDTSIELSLNANGESKSIIGNMRRAEDHSLVWSLATISTSMCVTYNNLMSAPSEADVVILAQIDSIPKCENFLVLARNRSTIQGNVAFVDYLKRQRADSGWNPMLEVACPRANGVLP